MNNVDHPLWNTDIGPPKGLEESQVHRVKAYQGTVPGPHAIEGLPFTAVAWKPSKEELQDLLNGGNVYLTVIGGLPPHFLTTNIEHSCYQS
jgi:hypothetical protein